MRAVLDANVLVALVVPTPYADAAAQRVRRLIEDRNSLHAPTLWLYEATSALRQMAAANPAAAESTSATLASLVELPIETIPPNPKLLESTLTWAERLGTRNAYDATYLALAEYLQAGLWTADQRLVRNCRGLGVGWVKSVVDS